MRPAYQKPIDLNGVRPEVISGGAVNHHSIKKSRTSTPFPSSNAKCEVAQRSRCAPVAVIESLENRTLLSAATTGIAPSLTAAPAQETVLGVFGIVNGKPTKLKLSLDPTHAATFSLSGGAATALQSDSGIQLEVTDISGAALTVTVTHRGSVTFGDVDVTGNLKTFQATAGILEGTLAVSGTVGNVDLGAIPGNVNIANGVNRFLSGDLAGTFTAGASVSSLKLGTVTGNVNVTGNIQSLQATTVSGTIYSAGTLGHATMGNLNGQIVSANGITALTASSMNNATVLAGADLGSDGLLGGTGSAQDSFAAGTIDSLNVNGAISSSFIGAGVVPANGVFGSGNDTAAGASLIKSIHARAADSVTRFESTAFGIVRLPRAVDPVTDPRFVIL